MSSCNYVVEQLEGGTWVPKCRYNFEDANFPTIAQNPTYRILRDGIDITAKYRGQKIAAANVGMNESSTPPMKPAAYKALSSEERTALQLKAAQLKADKLKRAEILSALNISEATYDTMRADMVATSDETEYIPENKEQPVVSKPASPIVRGGLLGRR